VCHVGREPWRKLAVDRPFAARSAFGVEYSHQGHPGLPCAGCHTGIPATPVPGAEVAAPMRLGPGHAACSGSACHALSEGPAPRLGACQGCHVAGLLRARDQRRQSSRWSVASRFDHARHERSGAVACETCHVGVARATTVAGIAPPAKASCAPCHDGQRAFKTTGTACARCHR
jgi:c(7)-type cytochrome triheme protein